MKTKNQKLTSLYPICVSYLQMDCEAGCPKIVVQANAEFCIVLRKIKNRLFFNAFEQCNCNKFTQEMDKLLEITAEISLRNQSQTCIDDLKERIWEVLEALDKHCKQVYKISVW